MTDTSEPSAELPDETPVIDAQTGEFRGNVTGLKNFTETWEHNVAMPHQMTMSGWQMVDDDHPVETGKPGFRLVHKTIRTIPFPMATVDFGTLRLAFTNGEVTVGEPVIRSGLAARRTGEFLVPEWGQIVLNKDGSHGYDFQPNPLIDFVAHQETFPPGNYVEILCELPAGVGDSYAEQLAAGRAAIAPLTALLDMKYGPRLLGPILTEEVGELFPDWHWNRKLGGRSVGLESQASLEPIDGNTFIQTVGEAVDRFGDLSDETRQRARIASQWYWQAEREPDNVLRFAGYWLVIEALELGENANISPVKNKVARILDAAKADVTEQVGQIYNKRNKLLHGKLRTATDEDVDRVRALATTLLEVHLFDEASTERLAELRQALNLRTD